jgi:hypothetical protein
VGIKQRPGNATVTARGRRRRLRQHRESFRRPWKRIHYKHYAVPTPTQGKFSNSTSFSPAVARQKRNSCRLGAADRSTTIVFAVSRPTPLPTNTRCSSHAHYSANVIIQIITINVVALLHATTRGLKSHFCWWCGMEERKRSITMAVHYCTLN